MQIELDGFFRGRRGLYIRAFKERGSILKLKIFVLVFLFCLHGMFGVEPTMGKIEAATGREIKAATEELEILVKLEPALHNKDLGKLSSIINELEFNYIGVRPSLLKEFQIVRAQREFKAIQEFLIKARPLYKDEPELVSYIDELEALIIKWQKRLITPRWLDAVWYWLIHASEKYIWDGSGLWLDKVLDTLWTNSWGWLGTVWSWTWKIFVGLIALRLILSLFNRGKTEEKDQKKGQRE